MHTLRPVVIHGPALCNGTLDRADTVAKLDVIVLFPIAKPANIL